MDATRATILVIDVGGTDVKVRASDWDETVRIPSGTRMVPYEMVAAVHATVAGRRFDAVSLGCPGPVVDGRLAREPRHLARGWIGFDFATALGAPVRTINDAAMQALGNYVGGRMLFLGFGTGLGTAIVADHVVVPLELAELPYHNGHNYEAYVGAAGRERLGATRWWQHCRRVACLLREAMQARDVVLGGGNARRSPRTPAGMRLGAPDAAFT
jgi:hypothetical protein